MTNKRSNERALAETGAKLGTGPNKKKADREKLKAGDKVSPISRRRFTEAAKAVTAHIEGQQVVMRVNQFSTGSVGWYGNEKITLVVDGDPVRVQINLTATIVRGKVPRPPTQQEG